MDPRSDDRTMLRFLACGSVDDGKSTLIGRLLYETDAVPADQLAALHADSARYGTQGEKPDFALLTDGLTDEREQGITIDVAYRYFGTARRDFVVADTPGHEQYLRNVLTGASVSDLALILVDARKGVLPHTRRVSQLVALLGISTVVVAVNKLDLVSFARPVFTDIEREFERFAATIGLTDVTCVPVSAVDGDNIVARSARTPWYEGLPLLELLESVQVAPDPSPEAAFRLPVQWVNRPGPDFRGYSGLIVGGTIRPGERVLALPSGRSSRVARILGPAGELDFAMAGQSVTVTLADELDISRGELLCPPDDPARVGDRFLARLAWLSEKPLVVGRTYDFKIGTATVPGTVTAIRHRTELDTLAQVPADTLGFNELGECEIGTHRTVAFDPYSANQHTGGFVVMDCFDHDTLGAGLVSRTLHVSSDVRWQALDIDKNARAARNGHQPGVVWFTGLSGAGKSTIANLLEKRLHALGKHTYLLDGDNLRHGLNQDLGFSNEDRAENIRRIAEVAKLMTDAGLLVLVSCISPLRSQRAFARGLLRPGEFCEVFVDTPLAVAEQRDPKGLYHKARAGLIRDFTGIDSPYEAPDSPEIRIDTTRNTPAEAVEVIHTRLSTGGW